MSSVAEILQQMSETVGRQARDRGAIWGNVIQSASQVPGQILADQEHHALLLRQQAQQDATAGYARDANTRATKDQALQDAAAQRDLEHRRVVNLGLTAAMTDGDPTTFDGKKAFAAVSQAGEPTAIHDVMAQHEAMRPKPIIGKPGEVGINPDTYQPMFSVPEKPPAAKAFESKNMLLDGKPATVNFDPDSGKYFLPGTTAPAADHATDPSWTREDGTPKGNGFLGVLKRPDGKVSSEISIGVTIGGKEVDVPTLVPTLTAAEKGWLLTHDISDPSKIPMSIQQKAIDFAKPRIAAGKSPFAGPEESPVEAPTRGGLDVSARVTPIANATEQDDQRYRLIQAAINQRQPVTPADAAWATGYEKQKTLGVDRTASAAADRQTATIGAQVAQQDRAQRFQVQQVGKKELTDKVEAPYLTATTSAQTLRDTISAAQGGNVVAAQLQGLQTTMAAIRAQGLSRINTTEIGMTQNAGSLYDNIIGWMGKKAEGQPIPANIQKDMTAFADILDKAAYQKYVTAHQAVTTRYGLTDEKPIAPSGAGTTTTTAAPQQRAIPGVPGGVAELRDGKWIRVK